MDQNINQSEPVVLPQIQPQIEKSVQSPEPKFKGKILKIIGVVVGTIIIIFAFLVWWESKLNNQQTESNQTTNLTNNSQQNNMNKFVQENFEIVFPSKPEEETEGQSAVSKTYSCSDNDGSYYSLTIAKYPQSGPLSAEQLDSVLTDGMNGAKIDSTYKIDWSKFGYLDNDRILDDSLQTQTQGINFLVRSRELFKDGSLYIIKVVYQPDLLEESQVNTFIESFKLTK
jgi:hypothetical protein